MEEIKSINASTLSRMFIAGAKSLEAQKDHINELNVFPVPDGDTGTNMTMTIMSAAKAVRDLGEDPDMKSLSKAISSGSLRGARGNSGVILSQLFRGFTKVIKTESELTVKILAEACDRAAETAYRAVMKPKEGTILTVARSAADTALELKDTEDVLEFIAGVIEAASNTLDKTPEMLPVLKQAGVVDSGGAGLLEVLKGAYDYLSGKEMDLTLEDEAEEKKEPVKKAAYAYSLTYRLVQNQPTTEKRKEDYLDYLSKVAAEVSNKVVGDAITSTMQTNAPGEILTRALTLGTIHNVVITNNNDAEDEKQDAPTDVEPTAEASAPVEEAPVQEEAAPRKPMGFVTVCAGEGMAEIFRGIGADYVISGGQTMNPSTDDILNAVDQVNADTVFVLPNNKNIILAANQAVSLSEDKQVIVIPTKTVPQGITALINYIPDQTPEENKDHMTEEIQYVKTGEITYAVRDTVIDDQKIHENDYMGIGDSGLLSVGTDLSDVFLGMLSKMIDEESALISIYYGADIEDGDAQSMAEKIREAYPEVEVEVENGGQPIYYYVISVE